MTRNYLQHASRHRPLGTDPIPGMGANCLASVNSPLDIHAATTYTFKWDALYDNSTHFGALTEIPTGLGIDFLFDGSDGTLTTTETGVWAFTYVMSQVPVDATVQGFVQLDTCGISRSNFGPGILAANSSFSGTDVISIPGGTNFHLLVDVTTAATNNPYDVYAEMSIVRLA